MLPRPHVAIRIRPVNINLGNDLVLFGSVTPKRADPRWLSLTQESWPHKFTGPVTMERGWYLNGL